MPKVSVIIPVYNVEKYLRRCLDSVVGQTLRDLEIICVDDGSTDGSAEILREYAAKDGRVKVSLHEHANAGAARNAGMAVAVGEYLGFVDSDDWCDTTLFEKAYAKAKADDADVVAWQFRQYDERTKKTGQERFFAHEWLSLDRPYSPEAVGDSLFSPITYAPWGRLVRRSFIESEGIRFQEIVRTNDVYFYCMVSALARRQTILNEVLYTYRVGTGTNLQANNADSPDSVFLAWDLVAQELGKRGLAGGFRKSLIAASANSLTYTLNVMPTTQAYCDFFCRLRKLYLEDSFYSTIKTEEIPNRQTATYVRLLKENETPLDFLVKQENYYRERLAIEYWSRVGAQKANRELQARLGDEKALAEGIRDKLQKANRELQARLDDEKALAEGIRDKLQTENERLSRNIVRLNEACVELQAKLAGANAARAELERSISFRLGRAITWLPRCIRNRMRRVDR